LALDEDLGTGLGDSAVVYIGSAMRRIIRGLSFYRATLCRARYMLRQFRLSAHVTRVYCIKTAHRIIEILSLFVRPIILIFLSNARVIASPPTGEPNTRGSNFRPICSYISETVIDRSIVTMEDEYKFVYALSNSATFNDLQ